MSIKRDSPTTIHSLGIEELTKNTMEALSGMTDNPEWNHGGERPIGCFKVSTAKLYRGIQD